jgi:class 3 adenylate cyclase
MKIGLTYGPVKRFNLGLPRYGYEDVLGGQTLDRMAEAEHHAEPGDILVDRATLAYLPEAVSVAEWRSDFAAIDRLLRPARPKPWPALEWPALAEEALIELVQTYVPNQIYEMMAAGQARIAELKPVVSLFVQFHGIDYDNDPDVGQKLQRYFATSQRIVSDYGGRLNRLITGDKGSLLHIIFGAPRTVEEQEARAVRCALELQRECGRLPFISMQRIGVSLGRVFAGAVGSSSRHDFTTMGDSINLSARLMQSAADHQVLLEEAVQRQLGPEFQTTDLGEITVKGKAAPIRVYAALAARSRSERRAAATFSIPIFGRDEEIRRLMESFEVLLTGQGGTVTLVGEVGMGKTHILNALRLKLASDEPQRIRWAEGCVWLMVRA